MARTRVTTLALVGVALASMLGVNLPTASAAQPGNTDPTIGPHARDEAGHRHDRLVFTAGHGRPIARQPTVAPAVSRSAPAAALANAPLQHEVLGFAPYWSLSQHANWNYNLLGTVAYFGLDVKADGSFDTTTSGWSGWNSQELIDTINRAHQAGHRAVIVIKAFDEATINQIVTTGAAQTAINNTLAAVDAKNLDGVNIDFEGYASATYPNIQSGITSFAAQMTAQMHARLPGSVVTIDTYSGSASWEGGIFSITQLAPVVDGLFVMAYDMASGNMPGHAGPNAPLNGWTYNDSTAVAQYLSKAPASKVILGVPYYGYKWSTTSAAPYGAISGGATAEPYSAIAGDFACAQQLSQHWDATAQSPWASWWSPAVNDPCGGNHGSWRELYYDDATSLGLKYDLATASGLRGVGIWALGYDGNAPELWDLIARKLVNPFRAMYVLDCSGGLHPAGGTLPARITAYWPNWRIANSAAMLPDASGGYVLDGFGALHPFAVGSNPMPANVAGEPYWQGWNIARDVVLLPSSTATQAQGYTLDGFGGVHAFGGAPPPRMTAYWNSDVARRLSLLSDGSGGYVLDAFGGVHPFAVGTNAMPAAEAPPTWPGWPIARDLAMVPLSNSAGPAGLTLDGFGGPHAFGDAGPPKGYAYWQGWDIARAIRLSSASFAGVPQGWVLDGLGGVHQFGGAPAVSMSAYWNFDAAVQLVIG